MFSRNLQATLYGVQIPSTHAMTACTQVIQNTSAFAVLSTYMSRTIIQCTRTTVSIILNFLSDNLIAIVKMNKIWL